MLWAFPQPAVSARAHMCTHESAHTNTLTHACAHMCADMPTCTHVPLGNGVLGVPFLSAPSGLRPCRRQCRESSPDARSFFSDQGFCAVHKLAFAARSCGLACCSRASEIHRSISRAPVTDISVIKAQNQNVHKSCEPIASAPPIPNPRCAHATSAHPGSCCSAVL